MQIKIPRFVVRASDTFTAWGNVPLATVEVRRLDILIALFGAATVVSGYLQGEWIGALGGGLVFILFCMIGLWM